MSQLSPRRVGETCQVSGGEPMTYYIILVMGICFVAIYSFVALNSNRFGMKMLLSKLLIVDE